LSYTPLRQICNVVNNQLLITLPDSFRDKKKVLVIVNDNVDNRASKLELLKKASVDPLFNADIKEINNDFKTIDDKTL
jgi:hypothetical protein